MNNSEFVGKLDTKDKEDIVAMEDALKAKYENKVYNKAADNKAAE